MLKAFIRLIYNSRLQSFILQRLTSKKKEALNRNTLTLYPELNRIKMFPWSACERGSISKIENWESGIRKTRVRSSCPMFHPYGGSVDWLRTIVFRVRKQWDCCYHVLICMVKTIVRSHAFYTDRLQINLFTPRWLYCNFLTCELNPMMLPRPPLLLSASNQNRHATQARTIFNF